LSNQQPKKHRQFVARAKKKGEANREATKCQKLIPDLLKIRKATFFKIEYLNPEAFISRVEITTNLLLD